MQKRILPALVAGLGAVLIGRAVLARRRRISLRDKVVIVTGGSRGLGLVMARELVRRGARVAICGRDPAEVERARLDLVARGGKVFACPCDLTDRKALFGFLTEAQGELGRVDVLINNAGVIQVGPMEAMNLEDFDAALKLHFWAPLYASLLVLPHMRRRHAGRIVNIASIGAKVPVPHLMPYVASKFSLYGLSTAMRAELAKDGVVVTTICPGLMRSGSPRHALIKGRQQAEYAWFAIGDSLPGLSMNVERAARQILDACERGDAERVLSFPAKLMAKAYALAPSMVQGLLSLVGRLLPSPRGGSTRSVEGRQAESLLVPSFATRLSDEAARQNNE